MPQTTPEVHCTKVGTDGLEPPSLRSERSVLPLDDYPKRHRTKYFVPLRSSIRRFTLSWYKMVAEPITSYTVSWRNWIRTNVRGFKALPPATRGFAKVKVSPEGFEPSAKCLRGTCSATELQARSAPCKIRTYDLSLIRGTL